MKAIFIENYNATEAIASRVKAFKEWATFGRPGDGSIAPVFVLESVNNSNVLITFDRTDESTNLNNDLEVYSDNELANIWMQDILAKETIEVFKELGGGKIMYADDTKSEAAIETFIKNMIDVKSMDQISLEAIRPLIKSNDVFMRYNQSVPAYEIIANENVEDTVEIVSNVPESYNDNIVLSNTGDNDSVDIDIDNNNSVPEAETYIPPEETAEEVSNPVFNSDAYKADTPTTSNESTDKGAYITETEVGVIREIISYLDEHDITINELLDSLNKFKMIVKQLMPGHLARVSADQEASIEAVPVNTEANNEVTDENVEKTDDTLATKKEVANIFSQLDTEAENNNTEEEPTNLDENPFNDDIYIPENEENVEPENNEEDPLEEEPTFIDNQGNAIEPDHIEEEPVEEPVNEEEVAKEIAKDVSNDNEFFEAVLARKDEFSKEFLETVANTKHYNKLLTGVEMYNHISVREYRSKELGLI